MTYRGNSGGVAFGYNMPENIAKPTLRVANSVFRNNSAIAETSFHTSSQTISKRIYSGRGGSMAMYSNASHHNISVHITDCKYENNYARSYGGGIYLNLAQKLDEGYSQNEVLIQKTRFDSNIAGLGGGGIVLFYPEAKIIDCNFTNNSAIAGGGIFVSSPLGRKQITYNNYVCMEKNLLVELPMGLYVMLTCIGYTRVHKTVFTTFSQP